MSTEGESSSFDAVSSWANDVAAAVSADNSDAESVGSDIPAQAPKGSNSQAANQLKDELQEDVNGEPDKTDPDEDDDEEADGDEEGV